ncbi:hypothetical protein BRC85_08125 [Halobacteriales archaeon QS_1_69_70]|nr:MAG: hypothetical protein BRC85_08125 [Halobacteriales archaeon QS_1_69_70]
MAYTNARAALTYAVSREMVGIYIVVLVGILLQVIGTRLFVSVLPYRAWESVRFVFTTIGFVATFIGTVALLYKLIADGTSHDPATGGRPP